MLALTSLAAAPVAGASAIVVVAEDGGFPAAAVGTVRSLAATELRARGIEVREVREDPRLQGTVSLSSETLATLADAGAGRVFVLRLGRLEQKVLITLEELAPPAAVPFAQTHAASSLDEADTVVPRLVRAVLGREPFERCARMQTVTAQESEPLHRRPGEGLFVIGLGLEPLGGSFGWSYEARRWRLGVLAQGADEGASFFGIDGAWPSAIIPFETLRGVDDVSWGLHLRCGF